MKFGHSDLIRVKEIKEGDSKVEGDDVRNLTGDRKGNLVEQKSEDKNEWNGSFDLKAALSMQLTECSQFSDMINYKRIYRNFNYLYLTLI